MYADKKVEFTEKLAYRILLDCGISCYRNNLIDKTAVDIQTQQGIKIDVQYSQNFAKYGDFRLDIISAFFPRIEKNTYIKYQYDPTLHLHQNFEQKYHCEVKKKGKIYINNYLDALIILFFNSKLDILQFNMPDHVLIVKKSDLAEFIRHNIIDIFNSIKINNKPDLDDKHGSAFIPIKVNTLIGYLGARCFYNTYSSLQEQPNKALIKYLLEN
ncbi:hypothetical protein [Lonepinella koalarum]|uniref:hypothetical protein n=1 Tax=Lonepinella koalarum TaxID=53417 RepID=UPI003F6DB657